jgi:hypothetical protein
MASYDRPDIAQGIFYEYLRYDDPISPELLANVVDGFPFLLAPLGMGIPMPPSSTKEDEGNHDWLGHSKTQAVEWAFNARKAIVESARGIGEAAGHHAENLQRNVWPHVAAAPGTFVKICQRDEETLQAIARWLSGADKPAMNIEDIPQPVDETALSSASKTRTHLRPHHHHHYLRYYYAGDEIGPLKFHPTINRLALILVHLYLLLLFIVSFPGSSYRIIMIRRKATTCDPDPKPYQTRAQFLWRERKSLSYFV